MMKYRLPVKIMKVMRGLKLYSSIGNKKDTSRLIMKLTTVAIDIALPCMCHGKISYTINHETGTKPI